MVFPEGDLRCRRKDPEGEPKSDRGAHDEKGEGKQGDREQNCPLYSQRADGVGKRLSIGKKAEKGKRKRDSDFFFEKPSEPAPDENGGPEEKGRRFIGGEKRIEQ